MPDISKDLDGGDWFGWKHFSAAGSQHFVVSLTVSPGSAANTRCGLAFDPGRVRHIVRKERPRCMRCKSMERYR